MIGNGYKDRQYQILAILSKMKKIAVRELSKRLTVSDVTIRRDLIHLEERGKLVRVHGGAVLSEDFNRLKTISYRSGEHIAEKKALANRAKELIHDGDTVFLDAGTTCIQLAKSIRDMNLRVVTHSLDIINELGNASGITLISIGGTYREEAHCFIGPVALDTLKSFQIETCFLVPSGFSEKGVFSSQNILESQIKREAIDSSLRSIILVDHFKYGSSAFSIFARAEDVDIIIIDEDVYEADKLDTIGPEIIIAPLLGVDRADAGNLKARSP